jgi:hypothetical protein
MRQSYHVFGNNFDEKSIRFIIDGAWIAPVVEVKNDGLGKLNSITGRILYEGTDGIEAGPICCLSMISSRVMTLDEAKALQVKDDYMLNSVAKEFLGK